MYVCVSVYIYIIYYLGAKSNSLRRFDMYIAFRHAHTRHEYMQ